MKSTQYLAWGMIMQYAMFIVYIIAMAFLTYEKLMIAITLVIFAVILMISKLVVDIIFIKKELVKNGKE